MDSNVDASTLGAYRIIYSCTDTAGNSAVTVTRNVMVDARPDTTAPVITMNGQKTVTLHAGDSYVDAGATCLDDVDGPLPVSDNSTSVDAQTPGNYTVTYRCTDTAGNLQIDARFVNVKSALDSPPVVDNDMQSSYAVDPALIANVASYASETRHGHAHVERWYRVLASFDAIHPMNASEAQGYSELYLSERWDPIVAGLKASDVSQAVIDNVKEYASETRHGHAHVERWYRVLASFDAIHPMNASEAQGYSELYLSERWDPVVTALEAMQ